VTASLTQKKRVNYELMLLYTKDYQPFKMVKDRGFTEFVAV